MPGVLPCGDPLKYLPLLPLIVLSAVLGMLPYLFLRWPMGIGSALPFGVRVPPVSCMPRYFSCIALAYTVAVRLRLVDLRYAIAFFVNGVGLSICFSISAGNTDQSLYAVLLSALLVANGICFLIPDIPLITSFTFDLMLISIIHPH
jgi:hypothetical protein